MSLFRSLSKVSGSIDGILKTVAEGRIDDLVRQLIEDSFRRWELAGWHRFDDLEGNCSVQLYRHAKEASKADSALSHLRITFEWYQVTPLVLQGLEPVAHVKRPDLRVTVGGGVGRTIECKRLKLAQNLPKSYVTSGILRFVDELYSAGEPAGLMVGFVVADDPIAIVSSINDHVVAGPVLGLADRLSPVASDVGPFYRYRSSHNRVHKGSIELAHYFVNLT